MGGTLVEVYSMRIEGKRAKAYRLYRVDQKDKIISLVAEADSLDELVNLYKRRRPDWRYKAYSIGKSRR
jgi:hypothetical protein